MKKATVVVFILLANYLLLSIIPADNAPHAKLLTGDQFEVMAHGTGQGHGPKNTLEAALIAAKMGASYIEMDVHRSRDDVFVTIHDSTIDATTDGFGRVRDMSLLELQTYDAGHGFKFAKTENNFIGQGVKIPTLESIFTALPKAKYVLEIKPDDATFAEPFCKLLRKNGMQERAIIASFHRAPLDAFRKTCPEIPTSLPQSEVTQFVLLQKLGLSNLVQLYGTALQVPLSNSGITIVTPDFIAAAHKRGLEVHVWTVNDRKTIKWLYELGVDGVITDFPDRALNLAGN